MHGALLLLERLSQRHHLLPEGCHLRHISVLRGLGPLQPFVQGLGELDIRRRLQSVPVVLRRAVLQRDVAEAEQVLLPAAAGTVGPQLADLGLLELQLAPQLGVVLCGSQKNGRRIGTPNTE